MFSKIVLTISERSNLLAICPRNIINFNRKMKNYSLFKNIFGVYNAMADNFH